MHFAGTLKRGFATKNYTREVALKILEQHFAPAVARAPKNNNILCTDAFGCWITDVSGKKFLDLQTGIGVANTGHSHPKVAAAIQDQATRGLHLQQNCMMNQPMLELIETLNENTPEGLSRFFFNVAGAEAVESAIKLARHETGKQNIIVMNGGFHGRSLATLAMTTSKTAYRVNYGPLPGGIHVAKYPYCLHCPVGPGDWAAKPACCGDALGSLKIMLKEQTAPSETAAVVIEPILGEGGYVVPPAGFFKDLRKLCDDNGMFLIVDEVQSGMGRTGKMWAHEHEGVLPDILVFAKAIASGLPLSGIATRPQYMLKSPSGSMGGTYGPTAIACAAGVATLKVINEENLLDNATARGAQLQAGLRSLASQFPGQIADVRGRGCMVGLEFAYPPGSGFAGHVTAACMDAGLLLLTTGWRETIRFIPPLVISKDEMDTALSMFEKGMKEAVATWKGPKPVHV